MKINPGIITTHLQESKVFYVTHFGLQVKFETEWFVLLETADGSEIAFMLPDIAAFHPLFQKKYTGGGIWLTFNVNDVDGEYGRIKMIPGIELVQEIKTEDWGERHFVIKDPNGIAIDIVRYVGTQNGLV